MRNNNKKKKKGLPFEGWSNVYAGDEGEWKWRILFVRRTYRQERLKNYKDWSKAWRKYQVSIQVTPDSIPLQISSQFNRKETL